MTTHGASNRNRRSAQTRPRPAFYKPAPRWPFFAALAAAIALEVGAVAVASLQRPVEIPTELGGAAESSPADGFVVEFPPEATPAPALEPPEQPPLPADPDEFQIEEPTPPPRPSKTLKPTPRVATLQTAEGPPGPINYSTGSAKMLSAPRPGYPYEARRAKQTGSGRFLLRFDPNGRVTEVRAVQSTGSPILDQVSLSTLSRWRCRPGVYRQVYVPITFTLAGAQL